jgi:hypothetical protein
MTIGNAELKHTLARHQAFWDMAEVDRPLVAASQGHPFAFDDFQWGQQREGEMTPNMLSLSDLLNQCEDHFQSVGLLQGDALWVGEPPRAIPWMEAIMGCEIRFSVSGRSIWAEPVLKDWADVATLTNYRESPWLALLIELTEGMVRLSDGRFPVVIALQRGPLDVAAALRGLDRLALDFYDFPEQFKHLLDLCTEANLLVAEILSNLIPPFHGGHANYFGLWAPGRPYLHQQDSMASFSPQTYQQAVRAGDETVMGAFDYSIRKFHSASLHILGEASSLDCVRGVQITLDPTGPTLDELVPVFAGAQQRKPLLINCTSREAMEQLRKELSPRGLCLYYWETAEGLAKLSFNR